MVLVRGPQPSAIVIRAGTVREAEKLMRVIERAIDDGAGAVLSVFVDDQRLADGEDLAGAIQRICEVAGIPHGQVQVGTAAYLTAVGIDLVADRAEGQPENHHHAVFSEPLRLAQVEQFIRCFEGPIPNPTGGKRRTSET